MTTNQISGIALRAWLKSNRIVTMSSTVMQGPQAPVVFATDDTGNEVVLVLSKTQSAKTPAGSSVAQLGTCQVINGKNALGEPRLYLSSGGQVSVDELFG
jgi:hypothetical protein